MSTKDGRRRRIVLTPCQTLAKQESESPPALPACTPNLMPFHIKYTGPAAMSMFFHVEKKIKAEEEEVGKKEDSEELVLVKEQNHDKKMILEEEKEEKNLVQAQQKPTSTLSLQQQVSQASDNTTNTSISKNADTLTRFISSFRGRTIHGLNVDVPTGYTGLLLLQHESSSSSDPPSPQPTTTTVFQSRVGRVLNTPMADLDDDNDRDIDMDQELEEEEIPLLQKLIPQSTFSSITLWHADRAVDEIRDEYYRTLTEWMALSHEVSC